MARGCGMNLIKVSMLANRVNQDDLLPYAGGDSDVTLQVKQAMKAEMVKPENKRLAAFYVNILHPASRAFEKLELGGVCVDTERMKELSADLDKELYGCVQEAKWILGGRIVAKHEDESKMGGMNLTKASMLCDYMFSPMGLNLKPQMYTEKPDKDGHKKPSTAYEHLSMFSDVPEAKAFLTIFKRYGQAAKAKSTYAEGFMEHLRADGRFHPWFFLYAGKYEEADEEGGTVTGRLSAKNPAIQVVPKHHPWAKRIRRCFVAPPGYVIVERNCCLPWDARIQTMRGLPPIKSVETQEKVVLDGEKNMVNASGKTGEDIDVWAVCCLSGRYLRGTPNHVARIVRGGVFQDVRIEDLKPGDYLISECQPHTEGTPLDENIAYLAGFYMGDGCYMEVERPMRGFQHKLCFACGKDVDVLQHELKKHFAINTPKKNGDIYITGEAQVLEWASTFPRHGSQAVSVPTKIWLSDLAARRAFLAGAFDSDGCAHGPVTISSICELYIRQLAILSISIGVFGIIRRTKRDTNFKKDCVCWHLNINSVESLKLFPDSRIPRKQERLVKARQKSYTQCRTQMIPMDLVQKFNILGSQSTAASNRLFSNGRRMGRITRDAIRKACKSNGILASSGIMHVLKYRYDPVVEVKLWRNCHVYNLGIEGIPYFNADGYRVHN
jgi:hypothetical protein